MAERRLRLGMLGYGTVGSGAYRMLEDNQASIQAKTGTRIEVARIGVKDAQKPRDLSPEIFTTDLDSIVNDPEIDTIVELIGGTDPAGRLVELALNNGKNVVTANKELMAKHGSRLVHLAKSKRLDLHYEAAVGGGIPLIQPLKHQLAGNDVLKMMGILNGTTNFILTAMQQDGADFAEVLPDAQAKGYAEADPTNDVDGFDTMYKISVLASIAFGRQVAIEEVHREGIRSISKVDMKYADVLGYVIKLLGICEPVGDRVRVRVHPTFLPKTHPLASVNGVYNGLWLHGDFVGDVMFSGRGAGSDPTASAVVGDLIDVARNMAIDGPGSALPYDPDMPTESITTLRSRYYIRIRTLDRPLVLGKIATAMGQRGVSIAAMEMKTIVPHEEGEIVFLTDYATESDFREAVASLTAEVGVSKVHATIRVED